MDDTRFERRTIALLLPLFAISGGSKLAGMDLQRRMFRGRGLPPELMTAVGLAELAGAGLLACGRTRGLGALALGGLMAGAVGTHLRHRETLAALPAAAVLGLCVTLVRHRRRQRARRPAFSAARTSPVSPPGRGIASEASARG